MSSKHRRKSRRPRSRPRSRPRAGSRSKRSGRKDKGIFQRWHARAAARNRYQLRLTTEDLKSMVDLIHDRQVNPGSCLKILKQSNRISHYLIKWGGAWLPIVYDSKRHNVVTFLPRSCLRDYMERAKGQLEHYGEETLCE